MARTDVSKAIIIRIEINTRLLIGLVQRNHDEFELGKKYSYRKNIKNTN